MREIRTSGSEEGFAGVTRRIYSPNKIKNDHNVAKKTILE